MNSDLSADTLRRAASMLDQIETFEAQFAAILDGTAPRRGRKPGQKARAEAPDSSPPAKKRRKRRKISPEARARIVAAVKARWGREKSRK